jgi:opacity protein-like surface antigen
MRRILLCAALVTACAAEAAAQGADDYPRVELYGGYSHARVESNSGTNTFAFGGGPATAVEPCAASSTAVFGSNFQHFFCDRRSFHGFDASATYNVSRYVGLKADVTGHYKSEAFVDATETNDTRERLHQFLFGVQLKDNSRAARLKPFAHALAGAARYTDRNHEFGPGFDARIRDRLTSFALKLGGGLDVRAGRHLDVRLFEFDYNPVFARRRSLEVTGLPLSITLGGQAAHNFAVGAGLAFH